MSVPCGALAQDEVSRGALDRPSIKASALYLIDTQSGRVLLQKDATRRLPPASLTKVMTALVALESASPHQIVRVDRGAIVGRAPRLGLRPGEQFLLRDLLAAMLVTSANDACQAIAIHVGGDPRSFIDMMNARAKTLGLQDTHFTNAMRIRCDRPLLDGGRFGPLDRTGITITRLFHDGPHGGA